MDEQNLINKIALLPKEDDKDDPQVLKARKKASRSYITWIDQEDNLLAKMCLLGYSSKKIANLLQRSLSAIQARMKALDLTLEMEATSEKITQKHGNKNEVNNAMVINLLRYWRNSIADMDKMGLSKSQMKAAESFPSDVFKSGQLPARDVEHFFIEAEKEIAKKRKKRPHQKNKEEIDSINKLKVVISPYVAMKMQEHSEEIQNERMHKVVYPLWMVADLMRDGQLKPDEERTLPWIERRCLTPNEESAGYPVIADVKDVDDFYMEHRDEIEEENLTWENLYQLSENLLNAITQNNKKHAFVEQRYKLKEKGYILPFSDTKGMSHHIIKTYDQYIYNKKRKLPKLLEQFCYLDKKKYESDKSRDELYELNQYHLGQMVGKYPLSPSQRMSLNYLHDKNDNDLFTIHGPPGTGKTTLLQSVIASLWIQSIIENKASPIIVACSSNNLAIQNILDRLQIDTDIPDAFYSRWLPNLMHFGFYLCPFDEARIKDAREKKYLYRTQEKLSGSMKELYSFEYLENAKEYYLQKFNQHYSKQMIDLNKCQNFLKNIIKDKHKLLLEILSKTKNIAEAENVFIENHGNLDELTKNIAEINEKMAVLDKDKKIHQDVEKAWLNFELKDLKWLTLFSWLPPIRARLEAKIKLFFYNYPILQGQAIKNALDARAVIDKFIKDLNQQRQDLVKIREELKKAKDDYLALKQQHRSLMEQLGHKVVCDNLFDYSDLNNLHATLDKTLRYELFYLATHYWEALWLSEALVIEKLTYDKADREKYWSIQAMLTPCLVTTFHSGPAFFNFLGHTKEFETASDFIDLLIIDEAGQTMPAFAAPMLSTAKKALFVGDAKQIEPIFKLTESIDLANTKKFGICKNDKDYNVLKTSGILCSGDQKTAHAYGNIILLGQRLAKHYLNGYVVPGLMLKEHRRCAKAIIQYCNELCYDGQLIPLTLETSCLYPRMGYAHIKGQAKNHGSSQSNQLEAQVIVNWLIKNKDNILKTCQANTLDKCIGIITPFRAQSNVINNILGNHGIELDRVGTVHALQGAQKPIIIFSSVYTANEDRYQNYFFDQSPNMLNVAVSRAQQAFLVFGDMDIFEPLNTNKPSGLLAKYLFSKEENEITDIIQPKFSRVRNNGAIEQITTLERHRQILVGTFPRARQTLVIVSPFLRTNAIVADNILTLIKENISTKAITVYTDPYLNRGYKDEFTEMVKALRAHGAKVNLVKNVHSKILAVDDRVIVEGSFNWLSAARLNKDLIREDTSILYMGEHVKQFIKEAIEPIEKKIIN